MYVLRQGLLFCGNRFLLPQFLANIPFGGVWDLQFRP